MPQLVPCCPTGSSAGAGSEVFHVYRHLRRRENDRQSYISSRAEEDEREMEFQQKLAVNKMEADARTAKKRAKRCEAGLPCSVWWLPILVCGLLCGVVVTNLSAWSPVWCGGYRL